MVHFAEAEEADQCVEYMNQRYLGKRRLLASTWDGKTKYEVEESEAEREERLKKWVDFLETGESADKNIASTASTDTGEHSGNGVSLEHSGNGASVNVGNGASIHIRDSNTISKGEGSETGQSGTSSSVPVAPIDSDSANVEESSTSEEKEMDTSETSMDADKSTESATHEKS